MTNNSKLITRNEGKDKVLNSFDSVFKGNFYSHVSQADGQKDGHWGKKLHPTKDQLCDHLRNVNVHKSTGPNEMHQSSEGIG